jgi:hypothetical protein
MKKLPLIETQITKQIRQVLAYAGAMTIKIAGGPYQKPGISDLLVCLSGRFIAIEVKRPGHHPTPLQVDFIKQVQAAGGIGFVTYSVEEVIEKLGLQAKIYPLFNGQNKKA